MAYSIEQAEKALRDKWVDDLVKKYRLISHGTCMRDVKKYGLPYRLLWDYDQRIGVFKEREPFEIALSWHYPHPLPPRTDKAKERYKAWGFDDEEQLQAWKMYFTRFLLPYADDIKTWSCFDLFGSGEHDQGEVERFRRFLLGVIDDYMANPDAVSVEPYYKCLEDFELYDMVQGLDGYMWNYGLFGDNDALMNHPQALEIMAKERELELLKIERDELECKERKREREQQQTKTEIGEGIAPPIPILSRGEEVLNAIDSFIEELRQRDCKTRARGSFTMGNA